MTGRRDLLPGVPDELTVLSVARTPGQAELSERVEWARAAGNALQSTEKEELRINRPAQCIPISISYSANHIKEES